MSLPIWTIYEHPLDYPEFYVARQFILEKPTSVMMLADSLEDLRALLPDGLTCLARHPDDDPKIVECWL